MDSRQRDLLLDRDSKETSTMNDDLPQPSTNKKRTFAERGKDGR